MIEPHATIGFPFNCIRNRLVKPFNLTFPIHNVASLYGGLDLDIEFRHNHTRIPLWGFIGLEIATRRHLGFIIEIDPAISRYAWNMFCLGIMVYI